MKKNQGLTVIELMIGVLISGAVLSMVWYFGGVILNSGLFFTRTIKAQQEVQDAFRGMVSEIRSMSQSALGGYAIAEASSSSLTFYSDIDKDGVAEQVRYFKSGTVVKKGIIKPAGNPLAYNPATEAVAEVVHDMTAPTPLFSYYDATFTGGELPLAAPINIPLVRVIKIQLVVQETNQAEPLTYGISLTPRNLRSN